jgi:hypothetical protein
MPEQNKQALNALVLTMGCLNSEAAYWCPGVCQLYTAGLTVNWSTTAQPGKVCLIPTVLNVLLGVSK